MQCPSSSLNSQHMQLDANGSTSENTSCNISLDSSKSLAHKSNGINRCYWLQVPGEKDWCLHGNPSCAVTSAGNVLDLEMRPCLLPMYGHYISWVLQFSLALIAAGPKCDPVVQYRGNQLWMIHSANCKPGSHRSRWTAQLGLSLKDHHTAEYS